MTYTTECSLDSFNAWSGGAQRLDELKKHADAYAYIADLLDDLTSETAMSETDVNDFLWFELDDVLEEAGYYDVESDTWTAAA